MNEVTKRSLTGLLLVMVVSGAIFTGPFTFLVILLAVNALSLKEIVEAYPSIDPVPEWIMVLSVMLLLPFSYMAMVHNWNLLWGGLLLGFWLTGFILSGRPFAGILFILWISLPLCAFYLLGWLGEGHSFKPLYPFAVIGMVWINDTFAYAVGKGLGKHKLVPRLSPEKTWEGLGGGFIFSLLASWFMYRITGWFTVVSWLIAGTLTTFIGLGGDLFESRLKRRLEVKHLGRILPGHGGMLDRFDSLLFTAPVMLIYFYYLIHRG